MSASQRRLTDPSPSLAAAYSRDIDYVEEPEVCEIRGVGDWLATRQRDFAECVANKILHNVNVMPGWM